MSVLERPAASWNACSVSGRTLSYLETSGSGAVSGGYVSVGETSVERNCFQMFGGKKKNTKNLLFKHELSICCHSALWAFRKHQMAAGSELLAAVCGLRLMPAGVCAFAPGKCGSWLGRVSHFLLHKPNFKIPCVEYFFQMWPCKSSFVALQTAQALFWWLCSMYVAISLYLGFISLEGTWSKAAGEGAGASPASWVHRQNILIVLCVLLCLW